jgi:hypothetical protein
MELLRLFLAHPQRMPVVVAALAIKPHTETVRAALAAAVMEKKEL